MLFKDGLEKAKRFCGEFTNEVNIWLNDYILFSGSVYHIRNVYGLMLDFVEVDSCFYNDELDSYEIDLNLQSFKEVFSIG